MYAGMQSILQSCRHVAGLPVIREACGWTGVYGYGYGCVTVGWCVGVYICVGSVVGRQLYVYACPPADPTYMYDDMATHMPVYMPTRLPTYMHVLLSTHIHTACL